MFGLDFNFGREYQTISNEKVVVNMKEEAAEQEEKNERNSTRQQSFYFLNALPKSKCHWITMTSAIVFMTLCLSLFFTFPSNAHRYVCLGPGANLPQSPLISLQAYPGGETLLQAGGGYCKVSCSDPCSTFPSVYGNLCCEWTHDADGGKSCGLHVTKENVCACDGVVPKDHDSGSISSEPVPVMVPAREPTEKKPKKKNDDGWEPMPWLPFKPFKPISIPDDAEECKQHCDNPCSWSQSNGVTYCCEIVPGKSCSTTQINGKCFCA